MFLVVDLAIVDKGGFFAFMKNTFFHIVFRPRYSFFLLVDSTKKWLPTTY